MTMPSERRDYITNSVQGQMTLLIVAAILLMAVAWFYVW